MVGPEECLWVWAGVEELWQRRPAHLADTNTDGSHAASQAAPFWWGGEKRESTTSSQSSPALFPTRTSLSLPHPSPWSHSPQSLQGLPTATAVLLRPPPPPARLPTIHLSCHCRPRSRPVLGRGVRMGSLLPFAAPPWVRVSAVGGRALCPSAAMSSLIGPSHRRPFRPYRRNRRRQPCTSGRSGPSADWQTSDQVLTIKSYC